MPTDFLLDNSNQPLGKKSGREKSGVILQLVAKFPKKQQLKYNHLSLLYKQFTVSKKCQIRIDSLNGERVARDREVIVENCIYSKLGCRVMLYFFA